MKITNPELQDFANKKKWLDELQGLDMESVRNKLAWLPQSEKKELLRAFNILGPSAESVPYKVIENPALRSGEGFFTEFQSMPRAEAVDALSTTYGLSDAELKALIDKKAMDELVQAHRPEEIAARAEFAKRNQALMAQQEAERQRQEAIAKRQKAIAEREAIQQANREAVKDAVNKFSLEEAARKNVERENLLERADREKKLFKIEAARKQNQRKEMQLFNEALNYERLRQERPLSIRDRLIRNIAASSNPEAWEFETMLLDDGFNPTINHNAYGLKMGNPAPAPAPENNMNNILSNGIARDPLKVREAAGKLRQSGKDAMGFAEKAIVDSEGFQNLMSNIVDGRHGSRPLLTSFQIPKGISNAVSSFTKGGSSKTKAAAAALGVLAAASQFMQDPEYLAQHYDIDNYDETPLPTDDSIFYRIGD